MSALKAVVKFCKMAHKKHQLVSNTLTTVALLGAGDMITQYVEKMNCNPKPIKFDALIIENVYGITSFCDTESIMHVKLEEPDCTSENGIDDANYKTFWSEFDWKRSLKLAVVGFFLGPFCHKWYSFLDKVYPNKNPLIILQKVALDQAFASPVCNITSIIVCFEFTTNSVTEALESFKNKLLLIYIYDCAFWPIAQILNFLFVSPVYRVLYVNSLSLLWNTLLSYLIFEGAEKKIDDFEK